MQFALFNLTDTNCEEINKFLRTHKILSSSKVFNPQNNSWSFCIEYQQDIKLEDTLKSNNKKDYMKELSVEDFAHFRAIRECRRIVSFERCARRNNNNVSNTNNNNGFRLALALIWMEKNKQTIPVRFWRQNSNK